MLWLNIKSFENDLYLNYKQGGAICLNVTWDSKEESDLFLFRKRIMKLAATLLASVRACSVGPDNLCIANNDAAKTTLCDKMKWYCHDGTAQDCFGKRIEIRLRLKSMKLRTGYFRFAWFCVRKRCWAVGYDRLLLRWRRSFLRPCCCLSWCYWHFQCLVNFYTLVLSDTENIPMKK